MIEITLKNPNEPSDFLLQLNAENLLDTVLSLKQKIEREYPNKPAVQQQKLIYKGKILKNEEVLKDILKTDDEKIIFHLVLTGFTTKQSTRASVHLDQIPQQQQQPLPQQQPQPQQPQPREQQQPMYPSLSELPPPGSLYTFNGKHYLVMLKPPQRRPSDPTLQIRIIRLNLSALVLHSWQLFKYALIGFLLTQDAGFWRSFLVYFTLFGLYFFQNTNYLQNLNGLLRPILEYRPTVRAQMPSMVQNFFAFFMSLFPGMEQLFMPPPNQTIEEERQPEQPDETVNENTNVISAEMEVPDKSSSSNTIDLENEENLRRRRVADNLVDQQQQQQQQKQQQQQV